MPTCPPELAHGQISNDLLDGAESDPKTPSRCALRLARTSGLDRTPLGEGADYLIRKFHVNCSPQCTAHRFCVMSRWKRCQPRPKQEGVWGEAKNCLFRLVPRVLPALRHRWRAGRASSGAFTHDTQRFNFSLKHKRCARARTNIWSSSQDGSSSCRCTMTLTGTRNARKRYANNIQLVSQPMPKYTLKGDGLFSDQEKKNNWYGSLSLQATWEMQLRRSGHDVHLHRTRTSSIQVFKP